MTVYEDRLLVSSCQDDETVSLGLAGPGEDPKWDANIPESLFARAQKIAEAYALHLLPVIDPYSETRLNLEQCRTLADELEFVTGIANDELLRQHLSAMLALVRQCINGSGRQELVIQGP